MTKARFQTALGILAAFFFVGMIILANERGVFERPIDKPPEVRTDGSWTIYKSPKSGLCYEVLRIGSGNGVWGGMARIDCP